MTLSLITSAVSDSKIGHIKDLLTPVLRRLLKNNRQGQLIIEAGNTLQDRFSALISNLLAELTNALVVTVDYARSLPDMIAAGKYDSVEEDITTDYFPVAGEGQQTLEVLLVRLAEDIESEGALKELDKLGLRAATLPELLAFGETYPDVQRQFPIVALGSLSRERYGGSHRVPFIGPWGPRRELSLYWFDDKLRRPYWTSRRFAAVRK